jgi:DNA invertase Pin-like site-specific DNA recombinase
MTAERLTRKDITELSRLVHRTASHHVNRRLIAYLRPCKHLLADQQEMISRYCEENGYTISQEFVEAHKCGPALEEAYRSLEDADGLIVASLDCFSESELERPHVLPPLITDFLHSNRHFIAVSEGIDTSTAAGQMVTIEMLGKLKDNLTD